MYEMHLTLQFAREGEANQFLFKIKELIDEMNDQQTRRSLATLAALESYELRTSPLWTH